MIYSAYIQKGEEEETAEKDEELSALYCFFR